MKNIVFMMLISSFAFSTITFNKYTRYGNFDGDAVEVANGFGLDFDISDNMSFGYDTNYGMMVKAGNLPAGLTLRLGIREINGKTNALTGLGFDWWTGGGTIKTTIGTSLDYSKNSDGDDTSLNINIGWGF